MTEKRLNASPAHLVGKTDCIEEYRNIKSNPYVPVPRNLCPTIEGFFHMDPDDRVEYSHNYLNNIRSDEHVLDLDLHDFVPSQTIQQHLLELAVKHIFRLHSKLTYATKNSYNKNLWRLFTQIAALQKDQTFNICHICNDLVYCVHGSEQSSADGRLRPMTFAETSLAEYFKKHNVSAGRQAILQTNYNNLQLYVKGPSSIQKYPKWKKRTLTEHAYNEIAVHNAILHRVGETTSLIWEQASYLRLLGCLPVFSSLKADQPEDKFLKPFYPDASGFWKHGRVTVQPQDDTDDDTDDDTNTRDHHHHVGDRWYNDHNDHGYNVALERCGFL